MSHSSIALASQHLSLLRSWTLEPEASRVKHVSQQLLRHIRARLKGGEATRVEGQLQIASVTHTQVLAAWDEVREALKSEYGLREADLKITQGKTAQGLELSYGVERPLGFTFEQVRKNPSVLSRKSAG
jgi:hypothetical protein